MGGNVAGDGGRRGIVVGYLRTPEGRAAFDRAVAETRLRDGRLIVVHSDRGGGQTSTDDIIAYREEFARLGEELRAAGLEHELRELIRGNEPAQDLLETARQAGAELIVIALRRRSPVGKLVLGSTAQTVLLDADCAVLAVKA